MDAPGTYGWILHQQQKNAGLLDRTAFDEMLVSAALDDLAKMAQTRWPRGVACVDVRLLRGPSHRRLARVRRRRRHHLMLLHPPARYVACSPIPTEAPFTADQRAWLGGFLAGMAAARRRDEDGAGTPVLTVEIAYGSQTGNSEDLAERLAGTVRERGLGANVEASTTCRWRRCRRRRTC